MIRYNRKRRLGNDYSNTNETKENSLSSSLDQNVNLLKNFFNDDETIVFRHFENQKNNCIKCCIIFISGMIKDESVDKNIIQPIVSNEFLDVEKKSINVFKDQVIISGSIINTTDIDSLVEAIISGDTVFFMEGSSEALVISSKGWQTRPIEEPETEKVLRGPREGFTESLEINLTMIRRKLKTPDLKFKYKTFGERSKTRACICYIEGIVNKKILDELYKRLDEINIDGVLDTGYIQELIRDAPYSPFRTIGTTERPDVAAAKVLEGRIVLILDGSPIALTLPFVFIEYFQAADDYYNNFYFTSISRIIRIISFFLTISVPAIYISFTTFHQEVLPTTLLLSISAAEQGTPFPTIVEAFGLLLIFEILRETGTRMPTYIGQALSIVGALVIGQAAVEARFVSAPMVIIVALSGITGLMTPKVKGAAILMRITFMLVSGFIGLYGFIFGITAVTIHLYNMRSFGVMYMSGLDILNLQDIKDTAIRSPWWFMKYRPKAISSKNVKRQSNGGK